MPCRFTPLRCAYRLMERPDVLLDKAAALAAGWTVSVLPEAIVVIRE